MLKRMHKNEITAFMIGDNVFRVVGTSHGVKQMGERGINEYHVASACLALGRKLDDYNDSGNHIMLVDEGKDVATVITIENYNIVIITAIDKADVFVKSNTIIENFSMAQ